MRDFREGFIAGASRRPDPGDLSLDWKRGWNAGRSAYGEAMRNEERRLKHGVRCPVCGRVFDPQSPTAMSKEGAWFCRSACAAAREERATS